MKKNFLYLAFAISFIASNSISGWSQSIDRTEPFLQKNSIPSSSLLEYSRHSLAKDQMLRSARDPYERKANTVYDRRRPEFDPIGFPLGDLSRWRVYPAIDLRATFDDNIFRTNSKFKNFDTVFNIYPRITFVGDYKPNRFTFYFGSQFKEYSRYSRLNSIEPNAGAGARLQFRPDFWSNANIDYFRRSQDPQRQFIISGSPVARGPYDTDNIQGTFRLTYALSPSWRLFTEAGILRRDYRDNIGSSTTYKVTAGNSLDLTSLIKAEIYGGYSLRQYDKTRLLGQTQSPVFGGKLIWMPLPRATFSLLTEVGLEDRGVDAQNFTGSNAAKLSMFGVRYDQEICHNWIASTVLKFENYRFDIKTGHENTYSAFIGMRYLISRIASVDIEYRRVQVDSDILHRTYSSNRFTIGLKGQF